MIVVRNCFTAKPGLASKLAAQIEGGRWLLSPRQLSRPDRRHGEFNRVVLEYEVASTAEFEQRMKDYATNETFRAKMKGYTDLYQTGSREILQVV
jgi:hypothetical protein